MTQYSPIESLPKPLSPLSSLLVIGFVLGALLLFWDYFNPFDYLLGRPHEIGNYVLEENQILLSRTVISVKHVLIGLLCGGPLGFFLGMITPTVGRRYDHLISGLIWLVFAYPSIAKILFVAQIFGHSDPLLIYFYLSWSAFSLHYFVAWKRARDIANGNAKDIPNDVKDRVRLSFTEHDRWRLFWWHIWPRTASLFWSALIVAEIVLWGAVVFTESLMGSVWDHQGLGWQVYNEGNQGYNAVAFLPTAFLMAACALAFMRVTLLLEATFNALFRVRVPRGY